MTGIDVAIPAGTPESGFPYKLLYSRKDAAAMISISVRALDYAIASKEILVRKMGNRTLVPFSSLKTFARGDHPGRVN
jgi:hypothetical protein